MSSTTVPAIWALTGLGITEVVALVFIGIVFLVLFAVSILLLHFSGAIKRFLNPPL